MAQLPKSQVKRLYADVEMLTKISPARNYENLQSLNVAAEHIYKTFKKLNCKVDYQDFMVEGKTYKNVIASFNEKKGARIVIGAHYDVCGNQDGADDNASGVAGLLETARLLNDFKDDLPFQIDFVAYSLEEPPFFATQNMGSAVHANFLKAKEIGVELMICYEMIGFFSDEPNSQEYPMPLMKQKYPRTANFIAVIGITEFEGIAEKMHLFMKKNSQIDVQFFDFPTRYSVESLSDHRNYWENGFPAVMINNTSFFRNPNYHKKADKIATLNFEKMAEVVNGVFYALTHWK
ncbi:MAG: M28 family peptidase [Bacteroidetes bacterium]|nr:MAG: M28 family peptidase [Bacteroidota bacterium]